MPQLVEGISQTKYLALQKIMQNAENDVNIVQQLLAKLLQCINNDLISGLINK